MHYRPEIDGLRAVAVVPVILYHAGYDTFSGGFVGVDVFFVISGYLITSILLRDFEAEDFSLTRFYARRARRLLPALFLVCLVSAIAVVLLMPPEPLAAFFRSLLAALGFVSNILFWSESGYFAEASELKPLLHTWSLAIEEQFYLIYPLFLMMVFPRSRRIAFILLCTAWVMSFAIASWASTAAPYANFFLIPSRAFELATGALIAFLPNLKPHNHIRRGLLAGTGLLAIAVAVFSYSSVTPFPGPWALLPVMGTAVVIIAASQDDAIGRLLSTPLLRWVGLISYSAYLWHWPIFVFARLWHFQGGPAPNYPLLIELTLLLAWLSWRFVETPFRSPKRIPRSRAMAAGGSVFAILVGAGLYGAMQPSTTETPRMAALEQSAQFSPMRTRCHTSGQNYLPPEQACTYHADDVRWATFGDSHTVELSLALADALEPLGLGLSHHSFSNCRPMAGQRSAQSACARWTDETLDYLAEHPDIETVVVTYRIHNYLWGDHRQTYPKLPNERSETARETAWTSYIAALEQLSAAGKQTLLLLQPPEVPAPIDYMMRRSPNFEGQIDGVPRDWWEARRAFVTERLEDIPGGVIIVDPTDLFCGQDMCRVSEDGLFLYADQNHLSVAGQARIAETLIEAANNTD